MLESKTQANVGIVRGKNNLSGPNMAHWIHTRIKSEHFQLTKFEIQIKNLSSGLFFSI